jgi:hypothetical protein
VTLFFDEDLGVSIPKALKLVGVDVEWVSNSRRIRKGTPDEEWIPAVGEAGYLVISCNKAIFKAQAQRQLLIDHRVRAVFLTSGEENRIDVLRVLLNKMPWLEEIDAKTERPFAFTLSINGRTKRVL